MGLEPIEGGDTVINKMPFGGIQNFTPYPQVEKEPEEQVEAKSLTTNSGMVLGPNETMENTLKKYLNKTEKEILEQVMKEAREGPIKQIKSIDNLADKIKSLITVDALREVIKNIVKREFIKGLDKAEADLDMNFVPNGYAIDYLSKHTFDNIKDMTEDLAGKLRAEFERAFMNGEGIPQIRKRVKNIFDVAENRATAIARTEANRISNMGLLEGYKQSGFKGKKKWVAKIDSRTSEICRRLNGQVVGINEKFKDPKTGEEFMVPPAHVNCRSTISFEVE